MSSVTGQTITASRSGNLRLKGLYYGWCGYCGCTSTENLEGNFDLGNAIAGQTYSIINKGTHQTCPIYGSGGQGVVLAVSNTNYNDPVNGPAIEWLNGQFYLELTYFDLKYDCLNGNCIDSTQYNTPGQYFSLSDCQAVCANGGACGAGKQCVDPTSFCLQGQVCIGQDEYTNIQSLISKINSEVC